MLPAFAARVGSLLGLPFVAVVEKRSETRPQKMMHNSSHQLANIAQCFEVRTDAMLSGPVLLIDDVVDSRWTFTVVAAQLREAGSGPVFPLALAQASHG